MLFIFSYSLLKSKICIHTEPGFPTVPSKLLTDVTKFLLRQTSYVVLPRILLLKLTVHSYSALKGGQLLLYTEEIRQTQQKHFTFFRYLSYFTTCFGQISLLHWCTPCMKYCCLYPHRATADNGSFTQEILLCVCLLWTSASFDLSWSRLN
jgi:hypothetical protein